EGYCAAGLQNGAIHFVKVSDSLPVGDGLQFLPGENLSGQLLLTYFSIFNQQAWLTFNQAVDFFMVIEEPNHQRIDQQQSGGADNSSRDAVVVADDRILHR